MTNGRDRKTATDFNPRAPCGARPIAARRAAPRGHFNPRAPCGARQQVSAQSMRGTGISIHAPLVGRDQGAWGRSAPSSHFNPRAPCGARRRSGRKTGYAGDFNPRAPCGARPRRSLARPPWSAFQSTRPLWGATANLTEFEPQICAWVTKSNRDFRGSAAACSVVLSGCAPRFWQRRCEPAGGGMIAWGSHQMISAPSGA